MCLSILLLCWRRLFPSRHFLKCLHSGAWHARKDLNPQPAVLETAALPIELRAYVLRVCFANLYAGYASIIIRDGYWSVKQFLNDGQRTADDIYFVVGRPLSAVYWLLRFAMQPVLATTRTELLKFQSIRVVALVLGRGVVAVLTLSTSQVDDYAVCFLCHFFFSRNEKKRDEG